MNYGFEEMVDIDLKYFSGDKTIDEGKKINISKRLSKRYNF